MNTQKYLSVLLLVLFSTSTQNAGIIGDVVNDTENIASDAVVGAENITNDVVNDTGNIVDDVVYANNDSHDYRKSRTNNNDNGYNSRYYRNNIAQDIVYTTPVTFDKVVHPINSIKRPVRTVGDILPVQTFDDYREDYEYRS